MCRSRELAGGKRRHIRVKGWRRKCYRPQTNEDARRSPDLCRRGEKRKKERKTGEKKRKKNNIPNQLGLTFFFFLSPRTRRKRLRAIAAAVFVMCTKKTTTLQPMCDFAHTPKKAHWTKTHLYKLALEIIWFVKHDNYSSWKETLNIFLKNLNHAPIPAFFLPIKRLS